MYQYSNLISFFEVNFIKKEALSQVYSENFKNTNFTEHLRTTDSDKSKEEMESRY